MPILGSQSVTLRRYAVGSTNSDGEYVKGTATDTAITGSFQPASGRDLEHLEEGERQSPRFKFYTTTPLLVADPLTGIPSDVLIIEGEYFEVDMVARLTQLPTVAHYKALIVRLKEAP